MREMGFVVYEAPYVVGCPCAIRGSDDAQLQHLPIFEGDSMKPAEC